MPKKEYKFGFSKYRYVVDSENNEFKVYRYNEEVTDKVMNNPLLDLMIAYNNLKENYDRIQATSVNIL